MGKVYYISRCQLKPANKKFSNLNNDYEMTFTGETQVVPCHAEDNSIPQLKFSFMPLQSLAETAPETVVGKSSKKLFAFPPIIVLCTIMGFEEFQCSIYD